MLKVYDFNKLCVLEEGVLKTIFDAVHSLGNYAKFDNAVILLSPLSKADEPYYKQYGFQDPATTFFEKLIDFHHDMLFLMIVVLVFVFYMLMACMFNFNQWAGSLPAADVRYNAKIETTWTVVPTLILLMVVVPAFSLIYSMDDTSSQPMFSVKIAGNQWYWTYEYIFLKPSSVSDQVVADVPKKSSFYPYVVPSKNGKHSVIFPKAWTSSSSEEWHLANSDFQMHIHILQSSLAPIKTVQEWFDFHINFIKAWTLLDQNPNFLKNMISSTKFSAPLGTYLLLKQWKNNGPSFSSDRIEEWISFNGLSNKSGFGLMRLCGVESSFFAKSSSSGKPSGGAGVSSSTDLPSSKAPDKTSDNFKMRAYSYDSTMLSEDDVIRSNGNKARLLSVDKPLYLPSNTLLTVAVTAYDVIHSWTVPSFGVKLDGCPGRSNTVSFSVKRDGLYYGQCSEICGVNHAFMPVEVRVFKITEFLTKVAGWA